MHYQKVDKNVKVAVYDFNPNGKNTIFFIHGWPLSHKIFEHQYDEFTKNDIRCISMDLRGFGKSDKPWNGYTYNELCDDVYNVIKSIDADNMTLLGFSIGASIAVRYMSKHNGYKVSKLALVGLPLSSDKWKYCECCGVNLCDIDDLIKKVYVDRTAMVNEFSRSLFANRLSSTLQKWVRSLISEVSGYVTIKTAKALREESIYEDIKNIEVPTAIFHGKLDKISPFEFARDISQKIKGSQLYTFNKSGHALFYDEMEKFNRELLEFVCD